MIDASGSGLTPRCGLGAVPLNSQEIAIMGGYTEGVVDDDINKSDEGQKLTDIHIFNVKELSLRRVA